MLIRQCFLVFLMLVMPVFVYGAELLVSGAWVREPPPAAKNHAAYMVLTNESQKNVEIVSVHADSYGMTMLHKTVMQNEMVTMQHVDGLHFAPGESITLAPGDMHIMLMGPKQDVKIGTTIPIVIRFSDGSEQTINADVRQGL